MANDFTGNFSAEQQELDSMLLSEPNVTDAQIDPYLLSDASGTAPYYTSAPGNLSNNLNDVFPSLTLQTATPPTIQLPPGMPAPNLAAGPSFNPIVGWHYLLIDPNYTPPPLPSRQYNALPPAKPFKFQATCLTPADSNSVAVSNVPTRAPTPGPSSSPGPTESRSSRNRKRKNSSTDIAPRKKKNQLNIIQGCICWDKNHEKVKRPKNAFILFRSAHAREISGRSSVGSNQQISKIAGEMWKALPEEQQRVYYRLAEEEKKKHQAKHPKYRYSPGELERHRFGHPDCTCGAYAANKAALNARREPEAEVGTCGEATSEDPLELITESALRQQGYGAPVATMLPGAAMQLSPLIDNALFAIPQATDYLGEHMSTAIPLRRSTRSSLTKDICYAENNDEDSLDAGNVPVTESEAKTTRRPAPISTGRPISRGEGIDPRALAKFLTSPMALDTPSQHTRSKKTPSLSGMDMNFDFDNQIDWQDLFGEGPTSAEIQAAGDDGDTIVVAARQPSLTHGAGRRRSSHALRSGDLRRPSTRGSGGR